MRTFAHQCFAQLAILCVRFGTDAPYRAGIDARSGSSAFSSDLPELQDPLGREALAVEELGERAPACTPLPPRNFMRFSRQQSRETTSFPICCLRDLAVCAVSG